MEKRIVMALAVLCGALCLAGAKAAARAPQWLTDTERAYPVAKYVRAVGEGASVRQAQSDALAAVSLYFDARTDVLSTAIKEARSVLEGGEETFSQLQGYSQMVGVSSSADFFCVTFSDAFYDKKRDVFSVLAYIDKADVAAIYSQRVAFLVRSIQSYRGIAQKEDEPFVACAALHKAQALSVLAAQYIQSLALVAPQDAGKHDAELSMMARLPEELAGMKKRMTFDVRMAQDDARTDPLFSTVSRILEEQGFVYAVKDARYHVVVAVSCVEERYDSGPSVRPSVEVVVTGQDGRSVSSYSKTFPRTGAKTMDQAYTRALVKIQNDLAGNLFAEYR